MRCFLLLAVACDPFKEIHVLMEARYVLVFVGVVDSIKLSQRKPRVKISGCHVSYGLHLHAQSIQITFVGVWI